MVLFDNAAVTEMTPAASEWIEELKVGDRGHGELPCVVGVVAVAASAAAFYSERVPRAERGSF